MDQSIFNGQWELSSLNDQILASSLEDHGFKIPHFSQNHQISSNITSPSNNVTFNSFSSSPLEYRATKIPKMVSWSSEQILLPKDEKREGAVNYYERLDWKYQKTDDEQVLLKARKPYAVEHIIAERKRREKLSKQFIALAAIIPGLKKADKASILGGAINYVKELEHNLKALEDQKVKRTVESVVVKNSMLSTDDLNDNSIGKDFEGKLITPEIQVRLREKSVLVRVLCENIKGVLVRVLSEVEKHHLTITGASAIPFVGSLLDVTVTAQMEEGFSLEGKDLAKEISSIFHNFKQYN